MRDMEVLDRLDDRLAAELVARRWRKVGLRRYVGATYVLDMLPPGVENRVTVFLGRCATPGDPTRMTECTRITLADERRLEAFLARLDAADRARGHRRRP